MSGFRGKNYKKSSSKPSSSKYDGNNGNKKSGSSKVSYKSQDDWNLYFPNDTNGDLLISQKLQVIRNYLSHMDESKLIEINNKRCFTIDINNVITNKEFVHDWPDFINKLTNSPQQVIDCFGLSMQRILKTKEFPAVSNEMDHSNVCSDTNSTSKINVQFVGLQNFFKLKDLKSHNYGKFVTIKGIVVRASDVKPICTDLAFMCVRCKNVQVIPQVNGCYASPKQCDSSECSNYTLKILRDSPLTKTIAKKIINLQELNSSQYESGRIPRNVECELCGDLTDTCFPGDIVILTGIVKVDNNSGKNTASKDTSAFSFYISANSITCLKGRNSNSDNVAPGGMQFNTDDMQIFKNIQKRNNLFRLILNSICPTIYGHEAIKAGLTLILFGGVTEYESKDSIYVRGDSHILIVGDPGLGKSQMLMACSNISPRGIYVCGNSTTASGLTVTITKEVGGGTGLEAGALGLADQGHCCIDEFDKMIQHSALLEAMEQQTISIAKSGVICTLPARTSIIAAANPTGGHYNKGKTVSENLKMSGSLLSRFDLVFIVMDNANEYLDSKMTKHVMNLHTEKKSSQISDSQPSQFPASEGTFSNTRNELLQKLKLKSSEKSDLIPLHLLQKYISYSRKHIKPKLTPEVCEALQKFYLEIRLQYGSNNCIPITPRHLESLIRLTEARAKVELREYCTKEDAEEVIEIMKYSMTDTCSDELGNIDFNRSVHGSGMSQRAQAKYLINVLTKTAERTADNCFTVMQMRQLAKEASIQTNIDNIIETLNTQGYLLKKGFQLYQLQTV